MSDEEYRLSGVEARRAENTVKQLEYLDTMGIQVWVRRQSSPKPMEVSDAKPPLNRARQANALNTDPVIDSIAAKAMDWKALRHAVTSCTLCELHETRTQTVFGVGNSDADLLFIGEAPGADEDRQGEPFVGRAGQLLTNMIKAIGLTREAVFIANILKCRPPRNRDPRPKESQACRAYLNRQIELIGPKVIVALGRVAAQNLLQTDTPIGKMRGRQYRYEESDVPVVVTYHPAYLLRSPREKRKAWQDLRLTMELLNASK